jgi:hypothetical protein
MPYVNEGSRARWNRALEPLLREVAENGITPGEANYLMTQIALAFVGSSADYATLNEAVGIFECAKLEFYRRMAAPYEDGKRTINGDVYPPTYPICLKHGVRCTPEDHAR